MAKHSGNQNIKAIILAGSRDFGRCPLASRLPTALWPILDKPALERLLRHISAHGIKHAVICSNGDAGLLQKSIPTINSMQLEFLEEQLPAGSAGCFRDAANGQTNTLFLIFPAGITSPPDIDLLVRAHRTAKSDLTVMLKPNSNTNKSINRTAEIYICEPSVFRHIPKEGYFDIKECLIPALLRAGVNVRAATLPQPIGNFRDRAGYLAAIANFMDNGCSPNIHFPYKKFSGSKKIWLATSAKIDPDIQIYAPVVIMDGATIPEKTVILGPAIIGRNVTIGKNTLIRNSVLWDGSRIGQNCEISNCIVDYNTAVPDHIAVNDLAVTSKQKTKLTEKRGKAILSLNSKHCQLSSVTNSVISRITTALPAWAQIENPGLNTLRTIAISIFATVFLWSYWPQLTDIWNIWQKSDEYSSGLLVPFLALYILWARRKEIAHYNIQPSIWGLFAFVGSQALRISGLFYMYSSAERFSLILSIASLTLLLFGWQVFRKTLPILLFLCLMLPLPQSIHTAVMLPFQKLATASAVFCLEMMGYAAIREGNIIHLNDTAVAVAEACNGLRMITSFFIVTSLIVLLVKRTWWEKLIVLLSSLPIAFLCNTIRLTITAIAFTKLSGEKWEAAFHDFGGYAMMPLALVTVIFQLWLLTKLTTMAEKTNL